MSGSCDLHRGPPVIAAHSETIVDVPVARIWELLTDFPLWEQWLPLHGGWPDGPPPTLDKGTQFRQRLGHLGIYDTVSVTVTENTANQRFVLLAHGSYGADARLTFSVDPVAPQRTRVRVGVEILGGLARPLASLAKRGLQKNLNRTTRDLVVVVRGFRSGTTPRSTG
nr:SRPBCC family protein [Antrihabitans stalactiti]